MVIGSSGSGKTTFAKRLAQVLSISHLELDTYHWSANWTEVSDEEFKKKVHGFLAANDSWIIDGNYSQLRETIWPQADTIIWLNYPFILTFYRSLKRSIKRIILKEKLFGGNVETFKRTFFSKDSILLWVIKTHGQRRTGYPKILLKEEFANADKLIFKTPNQAKAYLSQISISKDKNLTR
ncbi:MAG: AAA family ATPase [Chitinophagales bacterium]|nr:AAA family ATPase [Chitinophagales bacterium]